MSKIDEALARVTGALDRLEAALDTTAAVQMTGESTQDKARLEEEIRVLREHAEEDARLRVEAAGAVREALRDLRGAMTRAPQTEERANA